MVKMRCLRAHTGTVWGTVSDGDVFEVVEGYVKQLIDNGLAERVAPSEPQMRANGPTIEEWVAAGYTPENYPPMGYIERSSAGLERFRATGSIDEPDTSTVDQKPAPDIEPDTSTVKDEPSVDETIAALTGSARGKRGR